MAGNSSQIAVALTAVTTTVIGGGRRHGGARNRPIAIKRVASVYRGVGSSIGRRAIELHDFVERQVQHIGTLLGFNQHFGHAAVNLLHGIDVVDVRITRADYVDTITESVYRRMEAERKRVANELRSTGGAEGEKIRADADRQREVTLANAYRDAQKIKGEGDAEAARLYAEAFGKDPQFAQFYQSIEAYKAAACPPQCNSIQ